MSFLYEVRVRGRLSRTLATEFEQLALEANVEPVETVLSGPIEDQAALHGLLRRIESLGPGAGRGAPLPAAASRRRPRTDGSGPGTPGGGSASDGPGGRDGGGRRRVHVVADLVEQGEQLRPVRRRSGRS